MAVVALALRATADEKVTFSASAPDAVAVGDQFRLTYTVNTGSVSDFRIPNITDFEVLMGPSRSHNVQIINGDHSETLTFTYILMAKAEGEYTIPGATLSVKGSTLTSNALTIKVLPADQAPANDGGNQQQSGRTGRNSGRQQSSTGVADDDLFITVTATKTSVYEQEAFLLTYKIYTAVDLRGFENVKLPDFTGFHSQEVELPDDRKWGLEHYKGRNYQTTVYRQFVLFPQQSGKLTIDPARFDAAVYKAVQVSDPFEAFFNGGSNYVEVKKTLLTPQLTIESKPLPAGKPEGFSGGVGDFSISSSISATDVKTNDAVTVKVVISGTGNFKLISTPEVQFPEDFEVYDPKVDNKQRLTSAGLSGNQVIEYLAIPRTAGTYRIPAVRFSYFDTKTQSYKTLTTEAYELNVEKGAGDATATIANFTSKEDLRILGEDIRYIKQGDVRLHPRGDYFFGSAGYWLWIAIPLVLFVGVLVYSRQRIAANANVARQRTRKANKVAVKRMKQAGRLLSEGKGDAFYEEVLRALWGYVSDKLSIPVSRLSKDNIEEELRRHGAGDELTAGFLGALNDCEFARFAPGDPGQAMDKLYKDCLEIIGKMENVIKK